MELDGPEIRQDQIRFAARVTRGLLRGRRRPAAAAGCRAAGTAAHTPSSSTPMTAPRRACREHNMSNIDLLFLVVVFSIEACAISEVSIGYEFGVPGGHEMGVDRRPKSTHRTTEHRRHFYGRRTPLIATVGPVVLSRADFRSSATRLSHSGASSHPALVDLDAG